MRIASGKRCRDNQNTQFVFRKVLFENRVIYEIMWKNIVEQDRPQVIYSKRIAYWIPKATNTHSEYVILNCFYTATVVARTFLNIALHVLCLSCLILVILFSFTVLWISINTVRNTLCVWRHFIYNYIYIYIYICVCVCVCVRARVHALS
jgi:hypothetical protein